jgi:DNA-binding response OmpR family regulator
MPSSNILVVDDEPSVCQLLQKTLELVGYHVVCATGGRTASRLMRQQPFDLVITDVLMPDQDGLELIRELRHNNPSVRIVAMSGGGLIKPQVYLESAKGLGAGVLLQKPFNRDQLLAAINRVLAA